MLGTARSDLGARIVATMLHVHSFAPIAAPGARVLILGSMPGVASLRAQQYYAHPRNAFWPLMKALWGVPQEADYAQRCDALRARGVAVWDVLQACTRSGSLDSAIDARSVVANDVAGFLAEHPQVKVLGFNGATAARMFMRHVAPQCGPRLQDCRLLRLPSSSPAHAALAFDAKLAAWRALADGGYAR